MNNNAKFAFWYLLSLVALGFLAISIGVIGFQLVNKFVIDVTETISATQIQSALKFALASIIIAGPVYFIAVWQINKNLIAGKLDKDAPVRRWLTYFILFVAAVVIISMLIATINAWFGGDLSTRFILKILIVILLSVKVASYYFNDIRRTKITKHDLMIKLCLYGLAVLAVIALVAGAFIMDSPAKARSQKQDQAILQNFSTLQNAIQTYDSQNKKLPSKLEDLLAGSYGILRSDLTEVKTNKIYDYKIVDSNNYQLCATFALSNLNSDGLGDEYLDRQWQHDSGYQCIKQAVANAPSIKGVAPMPVPVK